MNAKQKILFIVENLSFPWDKRVWREASTLARQGYRVSVISPKGETCDRASHEFVEGIEVFRYSPLFAKSKWGYLTEYLWAFLATSGFVLKVAWTSGFDVLHIANPPDIFFPLIWVCRLAGKKIVFDHHDLAPECYLGKFHRKDFLYKALLAFEYLTAKASDAVVVTNKSYQEVQIARNKVPASKVWIVRNGPRLSEFKRREPDIRLKKGFPFMAAYIGVMGEQDGVENILRAAKSIVCDYGRKDTCFILIGEGDVWYKMKTTAKEWGLDHYVFFTGRISDEDAQRYLSTADVFLSPDPYNPLNDMSTMNKVMEFMAMGKPFVSFRLKEAMESGGESGIYVENGDILAFADGIMKLVDDPERAKKMGEIGEARVKNQLAWEHQEKYLLDAYALINEER